MKFTVLGSSGFVGDALQKFLSAQKHECFCPNVRTVNIFDDPTNLGHIIYSIGVPNFQQEPFKAIDAHVCLLKKILEKTSFESLTYISSARMYYNNASTKESDHITVNPTASGDLYNISKLAGESICLNSRRDVKIVRPSNITGNNFTSSLFIPSIVRDAVLKKTITLHSTLDSEKDYVSINDVVRMIYQIIVEGKSKIYNIAYGTNTKTQSIVDKISSSTDCKISVLPGAKKFSTPQIDTTKLIKEFGYSPQSITDLIPDIITRYKKSNPSLDK